MTSASFLLLAVLAAPLQVQAPEPTAAHGLREARALLDAVARWQAGDPAALPVDAYGVDLDVRERGETPHEYSFSMRYVDRDGGRLELEIRDPERGRTVREGFDGRRYWLEDDDGALVELSAHEYAQDRERIDQALELAEHLLLLVDLRRLAERADDLRLESGADGARVVSGRVEDPQATWDFRLELPPADADEPLAPTGLVIRRRVAPEAEEASGVLAPTSQLDRDTEPAEGDGDASDGSDDGGGVEERRFQLSWYTRFRGRAVPQVVAEHLPGVELPVRILEIRRLQWEGRDETD